MPTQVLNGVKAMALAGAVAMGLSGAFASSAAAQGAGIPIGGDAGSAGPPPETASALLDLGSRTYAPGVRMGSFVILPSISAAASYDDNVFAAPDDGRGDWYLRLDSELRAVSNWSRHALELYAGGNGFVYDEFTSENRGEARAGASGVLEIQHDLWARAFAKYAFGYEPRGTGESFADYEKPIQRQTFDGGVLVHKEFNRLWLELGGQAKHEDYEDARLATPAGIVLVDQDFRDGDVYEGLVRAGYELSAKTSFFVEGSYNRRDYQDAAFDSEGFRALGGVRYEFTRLVRGEAAVGYLHQDGENGRDGIDAVSYRGQILWEPSPLMTVALLGSRDVSSPSQISGGSNRLVSEIGGRADYAIWRDLTLSGGVAYSWVDYVDIDRRDDTVRILAGAEYQLNPVVSLFANDNYTTYDSDAVPNVDYDKNVVMMGVRARY